MELSTDYSKDFDPEWYLRAYYSTAKGAEEEGDLLKITLDSLHHLFNSGVVSGKTLLDIGTGPSIHSVISASKHVQDIYLSDYAEQNRMLLKSWWKGEYDGAYEEDIFKYIIEKENSREDPADRSSLVRNKIRSIIAIDVTSQNPILADDVPKTYDIVVTSLCLEAAATSKANYIRCVNNIKLLIKNEGFLIVVGVLNGKFYKVRDINFHSLYITKEDIIYIYKEAGFDIQFWRDLQDEKYHKPTSDEEFSDFNDVFVMMAKKI